jgi:hypothetical protein
VATTISAAKAKLAAKIPTMPGNYEKAMGDFFGASVSGSTPVAAYRSKVKPGMENTWETNLRRRFGV